jgi:MSHA biogenesis protein MshI
MKQQINLYQANLRPQKIPFSTVNMLVLAAFFVVVFAGIYVYSLNQLGTLESNLVGVDKSNNDLKIQIEKLTKQFPAIGKSKLLSTEIARLNRELESRREVQKVLAQHSLENKRVFSALLESLARKHVKGTWLTKVSISDGGEAVGFGGITYSSDLVPSYIQQLSEERSFSGLSFNVLELRRSEIDPLNLDFLVQSK